MEKLHKALSWAVVASEISHVFCCVLPMTVSLFSLLAGLGMASVMPAGLIAFHNFMHDYETRLIAASGIILLLGWGLHMLSLKLECLNTGCHHEPCKPKQRKASKVLIIATALFTANLVFYFGFHA